MNDLDKTENDMRFCLIEVSERAKDARRSGKHWHDGKWTREIKNSFVKLGNKLGYEVSANKCNGADYHEWLYDLAWYKYDDPDKNNPNRQMENLFLAIESEWGGKTDIRVDFEKLLVARAVHRLMVFKGRNIESRIDGLIERIVFFQGSQKGDRYLFAGWDWDEQKFIFRNYVV
ncbi:MAG: hypothetical protein P9X24_06935 [Candidatus Hatepunaea meridiana]|nr:hypothetical protein [Candidatus Hatepunaea meridiana]